MGHWPRAGPYAAYLGNAYNPIWTAFKGQATRSIAKTLQDQRYDGMEPYMGITPESRFELATATDRPADLTLDRLDRRRSLLDQFDAGRAAFDRSEPARSMDQYSLAAWTARID